MERASKVLLFGSIGCLLYCSAPVALLVLGGTGLGAAFVEWKQCDLHPRFLAISGLVGLPLAMLARRSWRIRNAARQISREPAAHPPTGKTASPEIPVACTLATTERKLRLEELAQLSRTARISARRDDLTIDVHYRPEAEVRVRQMVAKERECCPFLLFTFDPQPSYFGVRITAPESARAAVQEIYAQFALG